MKKILLAFLAFVAGFLPLAAQDWAPFRMGHTPYFQDGNIIHSLRLTNAQVAGTDSVFTFNPVVAHGAGGGDLGRENNNIFGWKLKKTASGIFRFILSDSTEAEINPNAVPGIPQMFMQHPNLDITLLSRGITLINNQPDSLLTYLLSNSDTIKLSRTFGLLSARSFLSYKDPNSSQNTWTLYRLPEAGMGQAANSVFSVYDFQPGDKFMYRRVSKKLFSPCEQKDYTIEVLSRQDSPSGDSVTYQLKKQYLITTFGNPNYPPEACQLPAGSILLPPDTTVFVVRETDMPFLQTLSFEYSSLYPDGPADVNNGKFLGSNNRITIQFEQLYHMASSAIFMSGIGFSSSQSFTEGLGYVGGSSFYSDAGSTFYSTEENLIAYIKGTETYGNWQPLVLSREEELADNPVQVYPNPFTSELTVKLPQSSSAEITIYNLQGQKIRVVQTNGEANLQLPDLPTGLYLLHVQQGEKSYSVKIQKQ